MKGKVLSCVSTLVLAAATAATAQAQTTEVAATDAESEGVGEIIVTAQKRSERLQDVPLAITAIGADQLREAGIQDLEDISGRSPGVYFKNLNVAQPQVFIRGIGTVQFDNSSEAPVGIFVDEVYIARHSTATAALYDVDRIEVLRGPQGSLYGRNTVGGAINVITKDPTDEISGEGEVEVGSYSAFRTRGAIGGPLGEGVSARLAFATNDRKGWTRNALLGTRANDEDNVAARAKLAVEPSPTVRLMFSADLSRDRAAGFEQELKGTQNLGVAPPQTELTPNRPYVSHANVLGFQNRDVEGGSARASIDLSDDIELTSISAYRQHKFSGLRDLDAGPAPLIAARENEKGDQFTQELRLGGSSSQFEWLVGGFYFEEDSARTELWTLGATFPVAPAILFRGDYSWTYDGGAKSYAAFAQGTYALSPELDLTLGLRYTRDEKAGRYTVRSTAPFALPAFITPTAGFSSRVSNDWDSFDPAVTLNYQATPSLLLYGSYKTGFKSGGFQHRPASLAVSQTPYDPENIKATEFGIKSDWFDRRLYANLSAFNYDYDDLQQLDLVPNTIITFTSNVGRARVRGAELELNARPVNGLDLHLGYAYLDAKYRDYVDSANVQRRGNRLNRAPEHAVNASAQYTAELSSSSDMSFRLEYVWRDEVFFNQDNAPVNRDGKLGLLNARVALSTMDERFTVALAASNLTKEVYCANQIVSVPSSSAATCLVGAPRQFSLNLGYRF